MHLFACRAAYVAACAKNFPAIHDEIFENQEELNDQWLAGLIKKLKIESCVDDPKTKEIIQKTIAEGNRLKIESTPTMFINGVKIEGSLPTVQLIKLLEDILKRK